jgi:acyl-CoA thioesterase-1
MIVRIKATFIASLFVAGAIALTCVVAQAASITIVALGASNTNGKGVGSGQAWPAVLEHMLQAKGYNVTVTVNATNGLTSSEILSRVDAAVVPGTQVVIYDLGRINDRKADIPPAQTQANKAQIEARIRARGACPIFAPYDGLPKQPDGHHLTAEGHALVAARLLPMLTANAPKHQ